MDSIPVPLNDLTNRQLHLHLVSLLGKQQGVLDRLDRFMADLTASVSALQGAVDNMAIRFASQIVPLTEALAAAQTEVANLTGVNAEQQAALTEALGNAQSAADAISQEVTELNSIGAAPEVPVEPVPVDDLPPAPSEEPVAPSEDPAAPSEDPAAPTEDPAAPTEE